VIALSATAKQGAYWIAFDERSGDPVVAAIFHESADIPNRAPTQR
jgi:hypothetical protein